MSPKRGDLERDAPDPAAGSRAGGELPIARGDAPEPPVSEPAGDPSADGDPVVPRLPRGRGIRWFGGDLIRIAMFATLLVAVVVLRKPCSQGVARFVGGFEVDAGPPAPPVPEGELIRLRGDETVEELERKLGRLPDAGSAAPTPELTPPAADAGRAPGAAAPSAAPR